MERAVPVIGRLVKVGLILLVGIWQAATPAAAEPQLVVVAGAHSKIDSLSAVEVRRLYLGIPVSSHDHEVVPLRNNAETSLQEVFLQRVVFMSAQAYERHMVAKVFRAGGTRIRECTTLSELIETLANDPWAVTYMSPSVAASLPRLRIVARL